MRRLAPGPLLALPLALTTASRLAAQPTGAALPPDPAVAVGGPVAAAPPRAPVVGHQVVTAAEIRRAGLARIGDLLLLLDGWEATTVDGFTRRAAPHGVSSFQVERWAVMVDDQPIELDLLAVRSLERLPVSLVEIDSVTVHARPGVYAGRFVDSGLIHIHTARPRAGLSARARAMTGSETGDPGPFRFAGPPSPNVDKLGHDITGVAGVGAQPSVAAAFAARRHFATDAAIRGRNTRVSPEYPIIDAWSGSVRAFWSSGSGEHSLLAGRTGMDDFFFLPALGREVPAAGDLVHAGVRGDVASGGLTASYRAIYAESELSESPNVLGLDFDWRLRRVSGEVGLAGRLGRSAATGGIALERRSAESGHGLGRQAYTLGRAFAAAELPLAGGVGSLGGALSVAGGGLAPQLVGSVAWSRGRHAVLSAMLAYAERLPEEDERIWQWHARGYRFLEEAGVAVAIDGPLRDDRAFSAEVGGRLRVAERVSLAASGWVRTFSGLELEERAFRFVPRDLSFASPLRLRTGAGGEVAGAEIGARAALGPTLALRTWLGLHGTLGGDSAFRRSRDEVPRASFRQTVEWVPVRGFALWAMVTGRSATEWADYRHIASDTDGRYSSRVAGSLSLDLSAQKWLADGRLRAGATLRNLLDSEVRHHPIGASSSLGVIVQGELLLDSIGRR